LIGEKSTSRKIAAQLSINHSTVERAAELLAMRRCPKMGHLLELQNYRRSIEREFESRYEVVKWMLDRQLDRRSPNKKKRTYVIGRRYLVEKGKWGGFERVNSPSRQNDDLGKTNKRIADQLNIGTRTVERAAEFTLAVDKIVSVTGIKINDLLDDKIKGTMDDIKTFADVEKFKSPLSQNGMFVVT
jgi:transcription initiation factor TFIIIB Brf1 subunit/transcription initiation factor TFIIB